MTGTSNRLIFLLGAPVEEEHRKVGMPARIRSHLDNPSGRLEGNPSCLAVVLVCCTADSCRAVQTEGRRKKGSSSHQAWCWGP